jgi:hypothetical protein
MQLRVMQTKRAERFCSNHTAVDLMRSDSINYNYIAAHQSGNGVSLEG